MRYATILRAIIYCGFDWDRRSGRTVCLGMISDGALVAAEQIEPLLMLVDTIYKETCITSSVRDR